MTADSLPTTATLEKEKPPDRLVVCVSSHPMSEHLIRTGAKLAENLHAEWFAIYVETPDRLRFSASHSDRLSVNLQLAENLGARVQSVPGHNVPEAVIQFVKQQGINKIVIGRPNRPRWQDILNGSIVDEIIRKSGAAEVYVINYESGPVKRGIQQTLHLHSSWIRYIQAAIMVGGVTLLGFPIHYLINSTNLAMIYLLVVVAAALFLGRGPSIFTSLLSAVAFDFFFTDPRLSFTIADTQYLLTLIGLLGVSLVISNLAGTVRDQVEASQQREAQTAALYALGRELNISPDLSSVIQTISRHVGQSLSRDVNILIPGGNGLTQAISSPGLDLDAEDYRIALWAFQNSKSAGRGTDLFPNAKARYEPLISSQGVAGVLVVFPASPTQYLSPAQGDLLETYCNLAGLAIERAHLAEQANQAKLLSATEKLQTALLNSISHDLRTPLATITGTFSSLYETESGDENGLVEMDHETKLELIETGWEEAERMNRLVGNLLDMTRLEGGALHPSIVEGDIEEVIGAALARLRNRLNNHPVRTSIPSQHALVPLDPVLVEQVLVNLLDNSIKYSPSGGEIQINVNYSETELEVAVLDRGQEIPKEGLNRVFDRFYRIHRSESVSGTGLGLSICKGIIEAHKGQIWAENREGGGTKMTFTIPKENTNSGKNIS